MLSGLISDTPSFGITNNTHPTDKVIVLNWVELAGVNLEDYGLAMLKAGQTWLANLLTN